MSRIVTVQDLSCLGRCSLTLALPVISAMGVECAVLPTALLSTHTGYPGNTYLDLTQEAGRIAAHWQSLGIQTDGIYTGYLAGEAQCRLAMNVIRQFPGAKVLVDPAMGDHGRLYRGLGLEQPKAMAALCSLVSSAGSDTSLQFSGSILRESLPSHARSFTVSLILLRNGTSYESDTRNWPAASSLILSAFITVSESGMVYLIMRIPYCSIHIPHLPKSISMPCSRTGERTGWDRRAHPRSTGLQEMVNLWTGSYWTGGYITFPSAGMIPDCSLWELTATSCRKYIHTTSEAYEKENDFRCVSRYHGGCILPLYGQHRGY